MVLEIAESTVLTAQLPHGCDTFRQLAATELSLALYRDGILPAGRAMELSGLTRRQLFEAMRERGFSLPASSDHADHELAWATGGKKRDE